MRLLTLLVLGIVSLGFSVTVYVIEKEVTTTGMVSQKEKVTEYVAEGFLKEVRVSKVSGGKMIPGMGAQPLREERSEIIRIFKPGKVITYNVNHRMKTYVRTEMPVALMISTVLSFFYECDMQGNCRPNENIKITNEFKKIGKWKARKVISRMKTPMGETETVLWVAKDKLLQEANRRKLENFFKSAEMDPKINSNPNYMKLLRDARKRIREFINKYGATVMSESQVSLMGSMKTVEVVKSVKKRKVSKDFFGVPKGYRPMGGFGAPMQPYGR
jgi:phosphopantetheine adenylyltransferase